MPRPRILVSNDDGVRAPGIAALRTELATIGDVTVVAPDRERSAASHSLTMDVPLRASRIADNVVSVEGTPTDCVLLAIKNLLPELPDLVVSGVNRGPNVGDDVTYSGTVAAAMEARILGVPSMAVSLGRSPSGEWDYGFAARVARELSLLIIANGLPDGTLLNVNVPNIPEDEVSGIEVVRQGKQSYEDSIVEKADPRGRSYYWIGGHATTWKNQEDTDIAALERGCIAVTPIHLDLTDRGGMSRIRSWSLDDAAGAARAPRDDEEPTGATGGPPAAGRAGEE
jgi:5'-nucleotidase